MKKNINKLLSLLLCLFILINSVSIVSVKAGDKYPNLTKQTDKTYTANNTTYDVYQGSFSYPSVLDETKDNTSVFYYSDGYFYNSSSTYDTHLSSMSLAMAMAACSSNIGNTSDPKDYYYKSQNIKKLMVDIGVSDKDVYLSDTYTQKMTNTTIAYAIGYKQLDDNTILMPIAIRGTGYQSEWYSNFSIGASGEHEGFDKAASEVYAGIQSYISEHNLTSSNIKFWIVGYSRSAATANLTAKRLIDQYTKDKVYAYTFGTPKGGVVTDSSKDYASDYSSIHNIINAADVISLMGPGDMGFIRYGVDHYVPGSDATSTINKSSTTWSIGTSNITSAAESLDNTIWKTNSTEYAEQKTKMLDQLKAIDSDVVTKFNEAGVNGTFKAASLNLFGALGGGDVTTVIEKADLTIEDYLIILLRDIESIGLYNDSGNTTNASLRETFANDTSNGISSISADEALKVFTSYYKALDDKQYNQATKCFEGITSRFDYSDLFMLYFKATNWNLQSNETKISTLNDLWDKLVVYKVTSDTGVTVSLLDVLLATLGDDASKDDKDAATIEIKDAFYTVFDFLLRIAATDNSTYASSKETPSLDKVEYKDVNKKEVKVNLINDLASTFTYEKYSFKTFVIVGSLAKNYSFLSLNHYPELTFAWVRSYDTYYNGAPSAEKEDVTDLEINKNISGCTYDNTNDKYYGDCSLTLSSNHDGTVILYRVYKDGEIPGSYKLYRNESIRLPMSNVYCVDIKAVYLGKSIEENGANTNKFNVNYYPIYINDSSVDVSDKVYGTSSGSVGYLNAYVDDTYNSNDYRFISWDKYTYNNDQEATLNNDTSKTIEVDGTFNYARKYIANYQKVINNVDVTFAQGSATPTVKITTDGTTWIDITSNNNDYNVSFTLDEQTDSYIKLSIVVTLYEDSTNNYYYSSTTKGTITNNNSTHSTSTDTSVSYDSVNGTLTLTKQYQNNSSTDNFYKVYVNYVDINTPSTNLTDKADTYVANKTVVEGSSDKTIKIAAKDIANEQFVGWYTETDGIRNEITSSDTTYTLSSDKKTISFTLSNDETTLYAYYKPLIASVNGEIDSLIVDSTLPKNIKDGAVITTKAGNTYNITGSISWKKYDTSSKTWSNIDNLDSYVAEADTTYQATITPGFKTGETNIQYAIDNSLTVTINGNTLSSVDIDTSSSTPSMKYIMSTKEVVKEDKSLIEVYNPSSIKVSRGGDVLQTIKDTLASTSNPITTKVLLADGTTIDTNVTFTDETLNTITYTTKDSDQIISVKGNVSYSDNPNSVSTEVTLRIVIPGLDRMPSPIASMESGTYNNPISVTLSTQTRSTEKIYYTLDNSDPTDSSNTNRILYSGEEISFDYSTTTSKNTGRLEPYVITAYVESSDTDNYRDSEIVTYTYTIVKKESSSNNGTQKSVSCEEYMNSNNWTWSEAKKACVYRVLNTKTS